MQYWIESQESQPLRREVKKRIDVLATSLINGDLINCQNAEQMMKQYAQITGEIQGLLYLEKLIDDIKEEREYVNTND